MILAVSFYKYTVKYEHFKVHIMMQGKILNRLYLMLNKLFKKLFFNKSWFVVYI